MKVNALASVAMAALIVSGCGGQKKPPAGPPPLAVNVAKASQHDIASYITLDGQIAPLQESVMSTPQSGTVTRVLVNEGDSVSQGQLLATLDISQLQAQLAANQATVQQSQARLQGSAVQAPISAQQYSSAVSQAQQNLLSAQNRVQTAQAALSNAKLVNESNAQLMSQGYVSQTAAEQARSSYVSAVQELNNARQAIGPAQAALRTAQTNTGQTNVDQATIAQNRASLAQARANVQLLQTQIAQSSIYAAFAGVVTQRLLDPGAFAGPNAGIVRVSQISTVYVNANVPDENLRYVRPGTSVTFTSASLPGRTFNGTVFTVNATPTNGTLSYRARLKQPNPDDTLRGGMLATLAIVKDRNPNATVVPRTAIFQSDQGANVYTVVDGKAKLVPVQIGLQTDTLTEVRGPVHPGTEVITTRPDALQDGSVVAVNGATKMNSPHSR